MPLPFLLLVLLFHHAYSLSETAPFFITKPKPCGSRCRFQLCGFRNDMLLGAPKVVEKEPICKVGFNLTGILKVGEASVSRDKSDLIPISEWRPGGLDTPFRKNFFGVGWIPGFENPGVVTKRYLGNQRSFMNGTCVVLPIKKYKIERFDGSEKALTARGSLDCLSFSVRTVDIVIELEWFSGDDLDLAVVEPDGTLINFRKRRSSCGRLLYDNCVDCCDLFGSSRERVIYRTSCRRLQRGEYRAVIRHATNCGMGVTKWVIRVVVNGVVTRSRKGESNKDKGEFAGRLKFEL